MSERNHPLKTRFCSVQLSDARCRKGAINKEDPIFVKSISAILDKTAACLRKVRGAFGPGSEYIPAIQVIRMFPMTHCYFILIRFYPAARAECLCIEQQCLASRLQSIALHTNQKKCLLVPSTSSLLLNNAKHAQAAVEEEAYNGCIRIMELYEKERNLEAIAMSSPALKTNSSSSSLQGMENGAQPSGGARFDLTPCA